MTGRASDADSDETSASGPSRCRRRRNRHSRSRSGRTPCCPGLSLRGSNRRNTRPPRRCRIPRPRSACSSSSSRPSRFRPTRRRSAAASARARPAAAASAPTAAAASAPTAAAASARARLRRPRLRRRRRRRRRVVRTVAVVAAGGLVAVAGVRTRGEARLPDARAGLALRQAVLTAAPVRVAVTELVIFTVFVFVAGVGRRRQGAAQHCDVEQERPHGHHSVCCRGRC